MSPKTKDKRNRKRGKGEREGNNHAWPSICSTMRSRSCSTSTRFSAALPKQPPSVLETTDLTPTIMLASPFLTQFRGSPCRAYIPSYRPALSYTSAPMAAESRVIASPYRSLAWVATGRGPESRRAFSSVGECGGVIGPRRCASSSSGEQKAVVVALTAAGRHPSTFKWPDEKSMMTGMLRGPNRVCVSFMSTLFHVTSP